MDELKKLLNKLEERLVQHDDSRKEVQRQLDEVRANAVKEADKHEEKLCEEARKAFEETERQILSISEALINITAGGGGGGGEEEEDRESLIKKARDELRKEQKFSIKCNNYANSFSATFSLRIFSMEAEDKYEPTDDTELIAEQLQEHLTKNLEAMNTALRDVVELCDKRRKSAEDLKKLINTELEAPFTQEDARLQGVVKAVKEKIDKASPEEVEELTKRAKLALFVGQRYELTNRFDKSSLDEYSIKPLQSIHVEFLGLEERSPTDFTATFSDRSGFSVAFKVFSDDEIEFLKPICLLWTVEVKVAVKGHEEEASRIYKESYKLGQTKPVVFNEPLSSSTTYLINLRIGYNDSSTKWSDNTVELAMPEFKECCVWKKCPGNVDENREYYVDKENPRIATNIGYSDFCECTIIGNSPLPPNKVTSWSIKILKPNYSIGQNVYIGIAPSDIDQNEGENFNKCGWYFDCYRSSLRSGPPHNHDYKAYGPRKENGEYVHTGDSVGVVMDTAKGELSFALNEVNYGVAYEGIPLDKPLVPCVILRYKGDSVELDTSEVKENNVDSSIPVPSNNTAKSGSWDSITLTWDAVKGASFYQIEMDGSKSWGASTKSTFTKRGLLADTGHTFRVRTVVGNAVSKWSGVVKGKTQKQPYFDKCIWKECPDDVYKDRKYSINEYNPRIATKVGENGYCTVIGNTPLPPNKVTSWNIKVLKSRDNDGSLIYIGVAPSDIDQNEDYNYNKCGWYIDCYSSTLHSGPPHNYRNKEYGPRKGYGKYVHTGDSVGVVMDTTNGELSFVLNGVSLGVAYEGIPLNKPLVPCVILRNKGDSVEIITSAIGQACVIS